MATLGIKINVLKIVDCVTVLKHIETELKIDAIQSYINFCVNIEEETLNLTVLEAWVKVKLPNGISFLDNLVISFKENELKRITKVITIHTTNADIKIEIMKFLTKKLYDTLVKERIITPIKFY